VLTRRTAEAIGRVGPFKEIGAIASRKQLMLKKILDMVTIAPF